MPKQLNNIFKSYAAFGIKLFVFLFVIFALQCAALSGQTLDQDTLIQLAISSAFLAVFYCFWHYYGPKKKKE